MAYQLLPELRHIVLQYLDNQNWCQSQLASQIFHLSTKKEIEQRKYLESLKKIRQVKNIQIKKFDIRKLSDNRMSLIIGKRGTGKSWLVRDLLHHYRDIPAGIAISETETANHFYNKIIPSVFIYDEYKSSIISNLIKRQKQLLDKNNIDPRAFLVMDDCLFDPNLTREKEIKEMFFNGRCYRLSSILTFTYPGSIPPAMRANIDYVFIFKENIISNRRKLYDYYSSIFPTFEMFCSVMDMVANNNYECLVIDNTSVSNKIEDMVYWYKANDHPNFTMMQNYSRF